MQTHASTLDAARAAALLEREEVLLEDIGEASDRRRCEIKKELAEIHRQLVGLGLRNRSVD